MSRQRRKGSDGSDSAGDWMNTYADMVTLLLTFFIMLFSMANVDKQKFAQLSNSLRSAFMYNKGSGGDLLKDDGGKEVIDIYNDIGAVDEVVSLVSNDNEGEAADEDGDIVTVNDIEEYQVEDLKEDIENAIENMNLQDNVKIVEKDNFLMLRFDSVILFDLSSADIRNSAKDMLKKIGLMLNKLDNNIIVQGHTDNLPINTKEFPSNWELSTKRSTNVIHFLVENCNIDASRLTATGNAEFKPVKPNASPENRQQNRRIDIVVSKN